jgi:hypothetical protein
MEKFIAVGDSHVQSAASGRKRRKDQDINK